MTISFPWRILGAMHTHMKIICTIGPAVHSKEMIERLIEAGMQVARLNFSHGTHAEHAKTIELLKEVRREMQRPLAIMLDTKGPEIRLGKLKEEDLFLKEGQEIWLVKEEVEGDGERITLRPSLVFDVLAPGMSVLLDNGYITSHIVEVQSFGVKIQISHGGVIRSTKGVNIPEANVVLPPVTEKDIEDIRFGCRQDVDILAASFASSAEQILSIRNLMEREGKGEIAIIAKIENELGVKNFDAIVEVADGIMIARGDLGVELPLKQVPRLQKRMIRKCWIVGKPAVVATQMLESMIQNVRPTRAEVSDVANAIYDSASAVMLSGETAIGRYPVETVRIMRSIVEEAEEDFDYYDFFTHNMQRTFHDIPSAVAQASVKTAYSTEARAIFAFTTSGSTARLVSRFRPQMPILAWTPREKVYHQLAAIWGVLPVYCAKGQTMGEAYECLAAHALERGIVREGDSVVVVAGTPFGIPGTTNMMVIATIGSPLAKL